MGSVSYNSLNLPYERDWLDLMDWLALQALTAKNKKWILLSHAKPDGDAIGSLLGLAAGLKHVGCEAWPVLEGGFPNRYRFMDPWGWVLTRDQFGIERFQQADGVAVVDTGTWNQLGHWKEAVRSFSGCKVVIDHHATQDDLGAQRFVTTQAEANCRLIHEAVTALGYQPDPIIAQALYTGLATDTGWFRHGNTRAESFVLAGELVARGANPTEIFRLVYESSTLGRLRLSGAVLDRAQPYLHGWVVGSEILFDDWQRLGARREDAEDLIDLIRVLDGADIAFVLVEREMGETRASLRSRGATDVANIAQSFGGGGHRNAAGFTHMGPAHEARALLLQRIEDLRSGNGPKGP